MASSAPRLSSQGLPDLTREFENGLPNQYPQVLKGLILEYVGSIECQTIQALSLIHSCFERFSVTRQEVYHKDLKAKSSIMKISNPPVPGKIWDLAKDFHAACLKYPNSFYFKASEEKIYELIQEFVWRRDNKEKSALLDRILAIPLKESGQKENPIITNFRLISAANRKFHKELQSDLARFSLLKLSEH